MAEVKTQFEDINAAAVDYTAPGAMFVAELQPEVLDIFRRDATPLAQRINTTPATGHPTRYVEQTAMGNNAQFTDPRTLTYTNNAPQRQERSAMLKALSAAIDFGLFDIQVTDQQQKFAQLQAKDFNDMTGGLVRFHSKKLWSGTDTSLTTPTTIEYVGLKNQIANTATIASGASIVDGLRRKIAEMVANEDYDVASTISAIYINPILLDELEKEVKNAANTFKNVLADETEVIPGLSVRRIITAAGILPLIPDPYLAATANPTAGTDYPMVVLSERLVEYHYVKQYQPQVFRLGLVGDLATKWRAVMFGAPIVKAPSIAHCWITVTR